MIRSSHVLISTINSNLLTCVDINRAITFSPPPTAASYERDCASRFLARWHRHVAEPEAVSSVPALAATSGAIRTGANPFGTDPRSRSRQPYSCVARIPASRATAATLAPGFSVAATSCCFSARLKRRRFPTDETTWFRSFFM
jgi:hypothetical protein